MSELKTVVVLDGEIINIGEWDYQYVLSQVELGNEIQIATNPLPTGATIENREMIYDEENGWQEVGAIKPPNEIEKLKADIMYLAIMTGVEL